MLLMKGFELVENCNLKGLGILKQAIQMPT